MERRSLFQFQSIGAVSNRSREIQIPLLRKKQLNKQHIIDCYGQVTRIMDSSFVSIKQMATLYEQFCKKIQKFMQVIPPKSNILLAWNIINLIVIFYNFIQIPIIIMIASNDSTEKSVRFVFQVLDICTLIILLLDLLLVRFRVAFYQNQELQLRFEMIFANYMKGGLLVDVVSFLAYFFDFLFHGYGMYFKIIFYIKVYTFFVIDGQVGDKLMYNQYSNAFYRFIRMVGLIFFLTSLQACIYFAIDYHYYLAQGFNYENAYLWLTSSQVVQQSGHYLNIIESFSWSGWYMFALYWAVQTTSSVGYGSITPRNPVEVLYCNVLMLTTICIFVIFADTIIDIVDQLQQNNLRRQAKFLEINSFTIANEAPKTTRKKITFFFDCLIQSKYDDSQQFIYSLLSLQLRQQSTLIFKNYIFSNLKVIDQITKDKDGNWNMFAKDLTALLKVSYHSTDSYIQKKGNTQNFKLTFIHRGKVTAFNDTIDYKKNYTEWDFFGQRQFFFGGMALTNIICRTFTKFYSFQKNEFFMTLKKYKDCYEKCRQMIDQVKLNNKLSLNFQINCYNCDQYHIFQNCPLAILWRDKLPRLPRQNSNLMNERTSYARKTFNQVKGSQWKKQSIQIDKIYFSKIYLPYGNL